MEDYRINIDIEKVYKVDKKYIFMFESSISQKNVPLIDEAQTVPLEDDTERKSNYYKEKRCRSIISLYICYRFKERASWGVILSQLRTSN